MNRDNRRLRLVFALLVVTSLTLLTADLRGGKGGAFGAVRSAVSSLLGPVQNGVSSGFAPVRRSITAAIHSGRDQQRIDQLQKQVIALQQSQARDAELKRDTAELAKLGVLNYLTDTKGVFANVISRGDAVDGFEQTARLDIGSVDRIAVGMPVVASGGLVGIVVRVSGKTSVVELIDDKRSDVFVDTVNGDHLTADVMGQGRGEKLLYTQQVPANQLASGTGLVTRQGSAYDEGIPVGILGPSSETAGGTEQSALVAPTGQVDTATIVEVLLEQNVNAPRAPINPQSPSPSPGPTTPHPTAGTVTPPRLLLLALSVVTAVVLQTTVAYLLPLPLGEPQFVVVVVLAIGLSQGPVIGACAGFGAGLLSDLDSVHAVGRLALVLTVAGLVAGLARDRGESVLGEIGVGFVLGVVALLSAGVAVADAGMGVLIGEGTVGVRQLVRVLLSSAAYDAVITPIVFPPLRAALLRLDPTRNAA